MAQNADSLLFARVFIFSVLLAIAPLAVANRDIPVNPHSNDMKQPEWLTGHGHSMVIPGIGPVHMPPILIPSNPYTGSTGGGSYIPGGDDTFVPNPGFEVPNPGHGGPGVPEQHP